LGEYTCEATFVRNAPYDRLVGGYFKNLMNFS
jgi:hypothetical protein